MILFEPLPKKELKIMSNIALFDNKGKKTAQNLDLSSDLFGLEPNEHLLYLAKIRQESNARAGSAHTKTRMEVRGGGAKPWKQKGTGRARAGSSNSPLWNGGGVIFGPRNTTNWTKGMNAKESQRAILSAINLQNKNGKLSAIENLNIDEAKTKTIAAIVANAGFEAKKVVFVVEKVSSQVTLLKRAVGNLVDTKVLTTEELNVKDLLKADQVIMTKEAISEIEEKFADILESKKNREAVAA
jgi:large subunit ribosomal protein L4